jgi:hypothetical protein
VYRALQIEEGVLYHSINGRKRKSDELPSDEELEEAGVDDEDQNPDNGTLDATSGLAQQSLQ